MSTLEALESLMSITFGCECGKPFTVADGYAGKRTKCPACGRPLTVPTPADPEGASAEDEAFRLLADGGEQESDDEPPALARRDSDHAVLAPPPARSGPQPAKPSSPPKP